jgi:hypothetical protein
MLLTALVLVTSAFAQQTDSVTYLIFAKSQYLSVLQPLADWKTRKGVPAKIMTEDSVAWDYADIKACITSYYYNRGTRYALLVGMSPDDIPTDVPDYDYGYADVNGDKIDDVWLARLPCLPDSVPECARMVDKILNYEQNPPSGSWFTRATTIELQDQPPDPNYGPDISYVRTVLEDNGYLGTDSFYGVDGSGSDQSKALQDSISEGRSFILFRGSSLVTWYFPFDVQPESVECGYKLPIIVSG